MGLDSFWLQVWWSLVLCDILLLVLLSREISRSYSSVQFLLRYLVDVFFWVRSRLLLMCRDFQRGFGGSLLPRKTCRRTRCLSLRLHEDGVSNSIIHEVVVKVSRKGVNDRC